MEDQKCTFFSSHAPLNGVQTLKQSFADVAVVIVGVWLEQRRFFLLLKKRKRLCYVFRFLLLLFVCRVLLILSKIELICYRKTKHFPNWPTLCKYFAVGWFDILLLIDWLTKVVMLRINQIYEKYVVILWEILDLWLAMKVVLIWCLPRSHILPPRWCTYLLLRMYCRA